MDFGDAIEIECFGFCIREFSLKNICELLVKDTWYKKEKVENFKINYINNSKVSEEDEKDIKIEDKIDINEYRNKSDIINAFFEAYPLEDHSKRYYKNELVYIRKRNENSDEYNTGIVYSRELGLSRPQMLYFNSYIEGGRLPLKEKNKIFSLYCILIIQEIFIKINLIIISNYFILILYLL